MARFFEREPVFRDLVTELIDRGATPARLEETGVIKLSDRTILEMDNVYEPTQVVMSHEREGE
jgi:hypothetical protein